MNEKHVLVLIHMVQPPQFFFNLEHQHEKRGAEVKNKRANKNFNFHSLLVEENMKMKLKRQVKKENIYICKYTKENDRIDKTLYQFQE